MASRPLRGLALCAGVGGLELGLHIAESAYRTVCYVEREAYAAATLVARMADKTLDSAPIWDDVTTFDAKPWRGSVDIVTAGFPCQPFSQAGAQRGIADERWLWDSILRHIDDSGAEWVFFENVPGLRKQGLRRIVGDLAQRGFRVEWDCFSAQAVGAPHLRKRLFVLAYRDGSRRNAEHGHENGDEDAAESRGQPEPVGREDLANAIRTNGVQVAASSGADGASRADAPRTSGNSELSAWPPMPGDTDAWRAVLDRWPSLEPAVCRVADGLAYRNDRLRAAGNGVVPLAAAHAWRTLKARIEAA